MEVSGANCALYSTGEGRDVGKDNALVGTVNSMAECVDLVQETDQWANGATMENPATADRPFKCFKETGQFGVGSDSQYVNCLIGTGIR